MMPKRTIAMLAAGFVLVAAVAALVAAGVLIRGEPLRPLQSAGISLALVATVALLAGGISAGLVHFLALRDMSRLMRSLRRESRRVLRRTVRLERRVGALRARVDAVPERVRRTGPRPLSVTGAEQILDQRVLEILTGLERLESIQVATGERLATAVLTEIFSIRELLASAAGGPPHAKVSSGDTRALEAPGVQVRSADTAASDTVARADGSGPVAEETPELADALRAGWEGIEAAIGLYACLGLRAPLPPSVDWSISGACVAYLTSTILAARPQTVIQFGSGIGTVVIAAALERIGQGRVLVLEHEWHVASATEERLDGQGLRHRAILERVGLEHMTVGSGEWNWIESSAIEQVGSIDLAFFSSGTGTGKGLAHYPLLPLIHERLSPQGRVIVDGMKTGLADDADALRRWRTEYPLYSYRRVSHDGRTIEILKRL